MPALALQSRLEGANRVAPRLWMGSAPMPGSLLEQWQIHVLVLCAIEYQPRAELFPDVVVIHAPMDDAVPTAAERRVATGAARSVHRHRLRGHRVLVTCQMGLNRSGLVSALALRQAGLPPCDAIQAVRDARSRYALGNHHFVKMIEES